MADTAEPASETARPDWRIVGDWFDLCNCAIGCPCVFGSNPTYGFCEGVLTWIVRGGHFGDVELGGNFGVVLVMHWKATSSTRTASSAF